MRYMIAADTDIGVKKDTNQDSISVKVINTSLGQMCLAVLCDGMGGLERGELASSTVVNSFNNWVQTRLATLIEENPALPDYAIRQEWERIVKDANELILGYGNYHNINLGTTLTAVLFTQNRYYVVHVGDSRLYELTRGAEQITDDQTLIQQEIDYGRLTEEEAKFDPRRSVLLQCIGVNETVFPSFYFGDVHEGQSFLICSDGFRHEVTGDELFYKLGSRNPLDKTLMTNGIRELINLNIQRKETDNISALVVRTY